MTRIVREHYPVDRLPPDLRSGLGNTTHVRIVVEDRMADEALLQDLDAKLHKAMTEIDAGRGLTLDQVKADLKAHIEKRAAHAK